MVRIGQMGRSYLTDRPLCGIHASSRMPVEPGFRPTGITGQIPVIAAGSQLSAQGHLLLLRITTPALTRSNGRSIVRTALTHRILSSIGSITTCPVLIQRKSRKLPMNLTMLPEAIKLTWAVLPSTDHPLRTAVTPATSKEAIRAIRHRLRRLFITIGSSRLCLNLVQGPAMHSSRRKCYPGPTGSILICWLPSISLEGRVFMANMLGAD